MNGQTCDYKGIMDEKDTNMGTWAASQTDFLQVNDG